MEVRSRVTATGYWRKIAQWAAIIAVVLTGVMIESSQPASANSAWGTLLVPGSSWNGPGGHGVDVFSNGNNSLYYVSGTYGAMYQCVELVQRFYAQWGYPNIWSGVKGTSDMFTNHPSDIVAYSNGSSQAPEWGDAIVFSATSQWQAGHISIVTGVHDGRVYFVEQNAGSDLAPKNWASGK